MSKCIVKCVVLILEIHDCVCVCTGVDNATAPETTRFFLFSVKNKQPQVGIELMTHAFFSQ